MLCLIWYEIFAVALFDVVLKSVNFCSVKHHATYRMHSLFLLPPDIPHWGIDLWGLDLNDETHMIFDMQQQRV